MLMSQIETFSMKKKKASLAGLHKVKNSRKRKLTLVTSSVNPICMINCFLLYVVCIHVMGSRCASGKFGFHFREIEVYFREIFLRLLKCTVLRD